MYSLDIAVNSLTYILWSLLIIKKAEHQRIDVFHLQCWRRPLRVPWTARRSNQSIFKEINPEYSLKGLMLKLKIQYFGYLMWRADSSEKTLMLGRLRAGAEGGGRGWDGWMASLITWTWAWAISRRWWRTGKPGVLQSMGWQRTGHDWGTEQQHEVWFKWVIEIDFLINCAFSINKHSFICLFIGCLR